MRNKDGENYASLVDTEHGMNWLYFGSDPIHNEAKTIPFEYISEWRLGEWLLEEGGLRLKNKIKILSAERNANNERME